MFSNFIFIGKNFALVAKDQSLELSSHFETAARFALRQRRTRK
jgi:hypothetical protein